MGSNCGNRGFGGYNTYLFDVVTTRTTTTLTETTTSVSTTTKTTVTKTTTTNTESVQNQRHIRKLVDEALASKGEFADKKVVVDLAEGLADLEAALENSARWGGELRAQEIFVIYCDFARLL